MPLLQWKESLSLSFGQWKVSRNDLYHFKSWPITSPCVTLHSLSPSASLMQISMVTLETTSGRWQSYKIETAWVLELSHGEKPPTNQEHHFGIVGFCVRNKYLPCLSHYTIWSLLVTVSRITFINITGFSICGKKCKNHDSWLSYVVYKIVY